MVRTRRKRVLLPTLTRPIAEEILNREVELIRAHEWAEAEVLAILPEIEGMYVQAPAQLSGEWIRAATQLKVIGNPGSGTNRIDMETATERGVPVVHAAGAAYHSVAEHAVGLMIAASKQIAYFDRYFHTHKEYPPPQPEGYGHPLHGKTVGIVGLGFIGRDLAHKCSVGFGMNVLAFDPYFQVFEARRQGIDLRRDLFSLLRQSDFVAITCPLNEDTRDLIGIDALRVMKATAFMIIVSRGGIVNERDLVALLQEGRIAGAGIDTWDPEPPAPHHPFMDMDNVVLTRHSAGGTAEDLDQIAEAVATQVLQALNGIRPDHIANPEVWPLRRAQER